MNLTGIEWTTFSANPLKYRDAAGNVVWGCVHTSPGCQHCYSEALAKRYGRGGPFTVPVMNGLTPFLDDAELHKMRTSKQIGGVPVSGSRCFIGDMTDLFGEWVPDDLLNRLFSQVLEIRTDVTWQILTKRADRLHAYLSWRYGEGRIPSRHIHIGVSVENQHFADERIPLLLQTPAAVRFISAEPLLGPLELAWEGYGPYEYGYLREGLDWVIVGGESGHGARPFAHDWCRAIIAQCKATGVACFVKQLGSHHYPIYVTDKDGVFLGGTTDLSGRRSKGGKMAEWPADLRVREFPVYRRGDA